jgi:membrane protein YdbS with pleckstrin-like domain
MSGGAPARASVFTIWPDDVVWRPLSRRLLWLRSLSLLVGLVVLAGAGLVAWYVFDLWPVAAGAAIISALVLLRLVLLPRSLRSWGYAERVDDLLVRHGLLIRRLSIVPYGRMQFVDVTAGPLERLFRLATVQLHTAAAASDAAIPGLEPDEAARLRDRLAALGEGRAEGL